MLPINVPAPESKRLLEIIAKERCIISDTFDGLVGLTKVPGKPSLYTFNYIFRGECVGHKYRESISIGAKDRARFSQDRREDGARSVLFNIDEASKYDEIIFVEGEFDVLAFKAAGVRNVVSVPNGAPSKIADFNEGDDRQFSYLIECEEELKGKRFILAVDNDGPGYNLRESLALRLGRGNCDVVTWPKGIKDANDYSILFGPEALAQYVKIDRKAYPIKGLAAWSEVLPKEQPTYEPCPVEGLDFFNIGKRNLYVITGIPGHGKSTLARSIAVGMARRYDWHITLGSFEDDIDLDLKKELDIMWRNYQGLRPYPEEKYIDWDKHFGFIFDEGKIDEAMTVEWLCAMMLDAKRRFNTDMVIIDPWNQLDHDFSAKIPETRYISSSLRKFKKTAMELDIVVVIVAHPRKMFGNEVPTLYSISGSAAWNDKVDCGIVVHKENYSNPEDMDVLVSVDKIKRRALGRRRSLCLTFDIDNYQYRLQQR